MSFLLIPLYMLSLIGLFLSIGIYQNNATRAAQKKAGETQDPNLAALTMKNVRAYAATFFKKTPKETTKDG